MSKNIKDDLTLSEKLYCVLQDLKDYNHNILNEEIDWIINQLEDIKSIYDEANFETPREIELEARVKELENRLEILDEETIVVEITEKEFEENKKLKSKLKIAEEYINFMASGNCPAELCEYHKRNFEKCLKCLEVKAQQALQKMEETTNE